MNQIADQPTALNVSAATTELVTRVLADFPRAVIVPRSTPVADEDISLEIQLPLSMQDVYEVRDRVHEVVIEIEDKYNVLILASAVPARDAIGSVS